MLIRVKVTAKAKKDDVKEVKEGLFEIRVREKKEAGLANRKMLSILAGYFGLPEKKIKIIKGHRSPSKIIDIRTD